MKEELSRTSLLIGEENINKLSSFHIAIFGLGGVGGYVVEALCRLGINNFTLIDNDVVSVSNLNRQIIATRNTIGQKKVDVCKERILSINPTANVKTYDIFFLKNEDNLIDFSSFDYVVDCIDTITSKITLVEICNNLNIRLISSMGTGNKLDVHFEVTDIYKTSVCPLCKVMRKELKNRNIKKLKVVYSKEQPIEVEKIKVNENSNKVIPGSISFVPASAGLTIASEVFKDLINIERK